MKKLIILHPIISSFFLLLPFFTYSQTGILKGKIIDGTSKESIPGASVVLLNNPKKGVSSDLDGNYSIELPIGKNKIICSFIGLKSDTFEVKIKENQITTHSISLYENTELLETVVVSSGKFDQNFEDITVSIEVINPKLIESKNSTNVIGVLEQAPGVTILDGDPQIRGGSGFTFGVGSRVSVVVDGIPMMSGDAGKPEWDFIPLENVERIEVLKGASSVLYGSSAINGVIAIETAFPDVKPRSSINYSMGIHDIPKQLHWGDKNIPNIFTNLNLFHSRIIKKRLDFTIGANFNYDQGYIGPPTSTEGEGYMDFYDTVSLFSNRDMDKIRGRLNVNLRYRPKNEKVTFGLNFNSMINKYNMPYAWFDDSTNIYRSYPGAVFLQDQFIYNIDPYINFITKANSKHTLKGRYLSSDLKTHETTERLAENYTFSQIYYAEYQFKKKFKTLKDLNLIAGAVGNFSRNKSNMYSGSTDTSSNINKSNNMSAYVQLDKRFLKVLNISAGVRMEYFSLNGEEQEIKPIVRAGLNLKITKGTFLRMSFGQGFRYPTITEKYIQMGVSGGMFGVYPNNDLKPETSNNYEIGLKQGFKLGKKWGGYLDIAGFLQEYDNTIEYLFGIWDSEFPFSEISLVGFKFINTGQSTTKGLDFSIMAGGNLSKKSELNIYGGYTFTMPQTSSPDYIYGEDVVFGSLSHSSTSIDSNTRILKYRFLHTAKIDIEYVWNKKINIGISSRYYSHMKNIDLAFLMIESFTEGPLTPDVKYTDFREQHNKGNIILDARVGYEFKKVGKISLIINNMLNDVYSLRPMKVEAPRSFALQYLKKF